MPDSLTGTGRDAWVVVAGHPGVAGLVEAARALGGRVRVAAVGPPDLAALVASAGVDAVSWFGDPAPTPVESYAAAIADAVAHEPGIVFAGRRPAERVTAARIAATLGAPILTGVQAVTPDGGGLLIERSVLGGMALETAHFAGPVVLVQEGGGSPAASGATAPVTIVDAAPRPGARIVETVPRQHVEVDLGSATRVVGVGRGLRRPEDLGMIAALAGAVGAELACTRPLAEGLEWLGRDSYIGISGQQIAPELYLAVGVSGQLQHMAGVRGAKTIVSVNTDPEAPIAAESDYVLVGDLYEIVPAITAALG
ncbi:MAG: electron transfer flavoprotein subunit alpha/FixB family protein [Bifidobacteriaceae bacterium]|jgi:electron transfer flavoprotein alpha subunit|nr:electron transfer flavoprotein subunit alpha/FixB family protein [Bifidobacteriaceae bacterium]